MKKIRNLKADEIEVRYGNKTKDGRVNMLLYIDSRSATDLLDETYGMANWTMEYKDVAGQIYGRLTIFDEDTQRWVYREDTGSESNIEAQKGLSSDILKRCIARFGCNGLYSSPKITLNEKDAYNLVVTNVSWDNNGKMKKLELGRPSKHGYTPVFVWNRDTMFSDTPSATMFNNVPQLNEVPQIPETPFETMCDNVEPDYLQINADKIEQLSKFARTVTGADKEQLKKFMLYYRDKVLATKEWTGEFNTENLWSRWNKPRS